MSSKQSSPSQTNSKKKARQTNMSSFFGQPVIDLSADSPPRKPTNTNAARVSSSSSRSSSAKRMRSEYQIYCDLDGVLVDFEAGVQRLFQKPSSSLSTKTLWIGIARSGNFFETLPWTADGQELWHALIHDFDGIPNILTGVPMNKSAREEKYNWCRRELEMPFREDGGDHEKVRISHVDMAGTKRQHACVNGMRRRGNVNVITCWSKNKHIESRRGAILIDDRLDLGTAWKERGGTFVHHTSTETTLKELRDLGILKESSKNGATSKEKEDL